MLPFSRCDFVEGWKEIHSHSLGEYVRFLPLFRTFCSGTEGRYGLEEEEVNANENFSRFDPRIDDRTHSIVSHGTETPSLEHIARPLLPSFEDSETPASYSDV